jgi:chromosome segregation ATPase
MSISTAEETTTSPEPRSTVSNNTFTEDTHSMTSDLSALSRRNQELDEQVLGLREQIEKYERNIEQFELVKSDWAMEKEALEDVLGQLREQLRNREGALNVIEAQKVRNGLGSGTGMARSMSQWETGEVTLVIVMVLSLWEVTLFIDICYL